MESFIYYYWAFAINLVYFVWLILQRRFRLFLPSTIGSFIWTITTLLVILHLNGFLGEYDLSPNAVNHVSRFTCYLSIASVIGFSLSHLFTDKYESFVRLKPINIVDIEQLLHYFKWIPYLCGIVGLALFIFLITSIGDISSFSDYRVLAIQTERVGYAALAQRISGHINILGGFYLMMLGYKSGKLGINVKEFLLYSFLCSAINMSIGGRVWILTSLLPFFTTYILSKKSCQRNKKQDAQDRKKIISILSIFILFFAIIGTLRDDTNSGGLFDKFLYLTDGSRMTNMVLDQYPETMYSYELGKSTLLGGFIKSPMVGRFANSIADDIGLSVTVKSIMPNLYYDFGLIGGAVFWGIICFLGEICCIRLKYSLHIIGLFLYGTLSTMFFQAPVGNVFALYTPTFEWIFLLYIFRKQIFPHRVGV